MAQRTTSDSGADEDLDQDVDNDDDVEEDESTNDEDDDDEEEEQSSDGRDKRIKRLSDENAKWRIRAREGRDKIKKLEADIEKLRSEGVSDDEHKRIAAERDSLAKKNEDLLDQVKTFRVGDAIRQGMEEHSLNPKRAKAILNQIDLDDIEVEDDGDVTGVSEALEKVAQDFPEWVMRSQGDGDEDGSKNDRTSGQSSRKPGTTNRKKQQIDKKKLAAQFPALAASYRPDA